MHHVLLHQPTPPLTGHLMMGDDSISATSGNLIKDGLPWFPVMGEFHFSRYDARQWRLELERMRQGGITVVSTYIFWHHHEELQGAFTWAGNRSLRSFIELCADLGLDAVVRIGPWAHGEARNGGFPDWLQALAIEHRSDDAEYLRHVRPFFTEIARELDGLYAGSGGPIVAIQLENELYEQPGHILTLKRLAASLGMSPPLWTATAWGGAQLPPGEVLPLYGGYPEAFWEDAHPGWARGNRKHYFFTDIRDDHSIGADLRSTAAEGGDVDASRYPYATCELGGGMPSAYHRRPIIPAHDVAALALAKIGSGSAWQGYYMFHGASQAMGELSSLQESTATGYPNDLPAVSYDFQAPLGEHGQVRESYHRLRLQHLFLAEAGSLLAGMPLTLPQLLPDGLDDSATVRWAVRSDGHAGFIFVNNHQPATDALPAQPDVQFALTLADGTQVTVPAAPVTIPAGSYFVWPFNFPLGNGVTLHSTTAELLTSVAAGRKRHFVFASVPGIDPVFVVEIADDDGRVRQLKLSPPEGIGAGVPRELPVTDTLAILLLDGGAALRFWKAEVDGVPRLVLAGSLVVRDGTLHLDSAAQQKVAFFPAVESLQVAHNHLAPEVSRLPDHGPFSEFSVSLPADVLEAELSASLVGPAGTVAPCRTGGSQGRAAAPEPQDYDQATHFTVTFTPELLPVGVKNMLRIQWTGDAARALVGSHLLSDNYWNGLPWEFDLDAHREDLLTHGLTIQAFPFNPDAAIYVQESIRPRRPTLDIAEVRIIRSGLLAVTAR